MFEKKKLETARMDYMHKVISDYVSIYHMAMHPRVAISYARATLGREENPFTEDTFDSDVTATIIRLHQENRISSAEGNILPLD